MTDPSADNRPPDPPGWPYPDLHLCSPHCPVCGWPGQLVVGANMHPMAWCENDACDTVMWDPSKPALDQLIGSERIREETLEDGTRAWKPGP